MRAIYNRTLLAIYSSVQTENGNWTLMNTGLFIRHLTEITKMVELFWLTLDNVKRMFQINYQYQSFSKLGWDQVSSGPPKTKFANLGLFPQN